MKRFLNSLCWCAATAALLAPGSLRAFPPAPYHVIYGQVRDEYGQPLGLSSAEIILEATNGVQVIGKIMPNLEPGVNYRLNLPMDSGIRPDLYKPNALFPTVPFRIRVKIGAHTYLPMEMAANYATLGKPAQRTRIDLTLGEDANGDGLPDAWQRLLTALLGPDALTGPNDDADGDGIKNLHEYLAGTYAFDPENGFRLTLIMSQTGLWQLEFMVIKPRTYTVFTSTNLQAWTPIDFTITADGPSPPTRQNYRAEDTRVLRIEPLLPTSVVLSNCFFKVLTQ